MRAQGETEVLKVVRTGKRQKKAWKRMVTKVCFVGDGFTRKPPKYERFIRPMVHTLFYSHYTLLCAVLSIASQLWFPVVTECSDPEHPGLHPEHDFGRLLYVTLVKTIC